MERIERLAAILMAEKGFQRIEPDSDNPGGTEQADVLAEPPPFGFVGVRDYWGSRTAIALVDADGLDLARMERFAERFFALIWVEDSSLGGRFGLLCFVFERPPTAAIIRQVRALKRREVTDKVWMAAWTLDLSSGRVTPHRWGPCGLPPGRAFMEEAIRRV